MYLLNVYIHTGCLCCPTAANTPFQYTVNINHIPENTSGTGRLMVMNGIGIVKSVYRINPFDFVADGILPCLS